MPVQVRDFVWCPRKRGVRARSTRLPKSGAVVHGRSIFICSTTISSASRDLALGPDFTVLDDQRAPGRAGLTGRLTTEWRQAALCPLGVPAPRRVGADVVEAGVAVVEQERAALSQHVVGRVQPL